MCKRALDVIVSVVSLLLLTPVLVAIGVLVLCALGRPVLLRQWRPGLHGRPFVIYKFRTMTEERDADGNLLPDEERVTRVGRFLRHTSLDELPELYNVVRGEMSLVGPRPYLPRESEEIGATQSEILRVPPGITGAWQVSGRNHTLFSKRVRMDAHYVRDWSIWLDIVLLVRTLKTLLFDRAAY